MNAGDRLKDAREKAGFSSAAEAATALGVPYQTYITHEKGTRGFKGHAESYARRFQTTPEWLLFGRGKGVTSAPVPVNRLINVIGKVQAGLFAVVPDEDEIEEVIPLVMPGFEAASLFALRVVGESMNRFYPDGTLVIVCPAAEIGVRDGDHVVVRHMRNGLAETTLKEVVQEKAGIALWPRSSDPAFQAPVRLTRDADADDGHEIIGVVVSSYVMRPIQRKPLLNL